MAEKYRARLAANPGGYFPDEVVLDGPALRNHDRDQMAELARSIIDGDGRAERWGEYLVATRNLVAAEQFGADEAALEWLADAVSVAWNALEADRSASLYLKLPDARAIAHVLDDVAGRVGSVKP